MTTPREKALALADEADRYAALYRIHEDLGNDAAAGAGAGPGGSGSQRSGEVRRGA